jgi:hypothetical protein
MWKRARHDDIEQYPALDLGAPGTMTESWAQG